MASPITLPIATIQPTFLSVIDDVREGLIPFEDFWISCYKQGEASVHGKVKVSLPEEEGDRSRVRLEARDGVEINSLGGSSYSIACPALRIPHTKVALPRQTFTDTQRSDPQLPQQISAFDVSPDGAQLATGYNDGTIFLTPITSLASRARPPSSHPNQVSCKAHLSTVNDVRFFPSSRVLLSAGADFTMNILPADLPSTSTEGSLPFKPVRSFKAHTRSITRTAIVSRGRNVLSCSKDGTVRLWDVGGGQQIRAMWSQRYASISDMSLGEKGEVKVGADPDGESIEDGVKVDVDSREVDTGDKVVFCALQDGHYEVLDLSSKRSIYHSAVEGGGGKKPALTAISYSPVHNLMATGSSNGVVTAYDTRHLASPLTSFARNGSSIEDLAFTVPSAWLRSASMASEAEVGLLIATEDGLPYIAEVRPEGPGVVAELVGGDCDAVRVVRVRDESGGDIWTAGDDGVVRRY